MTPPPIRYPLPTTLAIVLLAVLSWWGRSWIGSVAGTVRSGWDRVVSGPPVPSSTEPKHRAWPIVRRVLLLREGVEATDLSGGRPIERIGRRIFAEVYDVWPLQGEPTHYRIGNRRPIGWVPADAVLTWDTRLVLIPNGDPLPTRSGPGDEAPRVAPVDLGGVPVPVIDWEGGAVRIASWAPGEPWSRVDQTGWVRVDEGAFGVLLSRPELLEMMRRSLGADAEAARILRTEAVIGRLSEGKPLDRSEAEAARSALPAGILDGRPGGEESSSDRLGRLNDSWRADAAWSGIEYRAIPLSALPD